MKRMVGWACALALGGTVSAGAGLADLVARASLVSDHEVVAPGSVFTLAIRLQMPDDAYVYWRNPGDAGLPTQVTWLLPDGFTAEKLEWPVPGIFDEETLRSFGYKGEAVLFSRVRAPDTLPDSGALRFGAKSEWLICREACVPGDAHVEMELSAGRDARPDAKGQELIERFRAKLPETRDGDSGSFSADSESIIVQISIPGVEFPVGDDAVIFLPYAEGVVEPAARQAVRRKEEGIELSLQRDVMRRDPGQALEGVLLLRRAGRIQRALEVRFVSDSGA